MIDMKNILIPKEDLILKYSYGAPDNISLVVSEGMRHEMDNSALISFMK